MAFTTRATLLCRISSGDEIGWHEFVQMYRPLIILRGRDRGLRDSELDDLVQNVLVSLYEGQDRFTYDREKGRFRDYLKKIIDCRAFDILRKRRPKDKSMQLLAQQGALLSSDDHEKAEARWDQAWHRHLLRQALELVREDVNEKTYQAFVMSVLDEVDPKTTADSLGISVDSVYAAKHRIVKRLGPIMQELEAEI